MKALFRTGPCVIALTCLPIGGVSSGLAQTHSPAPTVQKPVVQEPVVQEKEAHMTHHASGTFEVKLVPQKDENQDATLGRMSIDKHYHGGLEATGLGQMLTAGTDVKGSAGYVAIERITGTIDDRTGSFILQHSGTLDRGAAQQSITVVPDSGTGQLMGIAGKMTITIAPDGKHSYDFDYTLPATD